MQEVDLIRKRYEKRKSLNKDNINSYLDKYYRYSFREREEMVIRSIQKYLLPKRKISDLKVLELGCGMGINLQSFVKCGIQPENLCGNDIMEDRIDLARERLPDKVRLIAGDTNNIDDKEKFDIVYQAMMFTSILDSELKKSIAEKMWNLTKKDGLIMWYDFTFDNPKNKDVKGIRLNEIKSLFPEGMIEHKRITLAPPIGRVLLNKINSTIIFRALDMIPFLKTHIFCVIRKP